MQHQKRVEETLDRPHLPSTPHLKQTSKHKGQLVRIKLSRLHSAGMHFYTRQQYLATISRRKLLQTANSPHTRYEYAPEMGVSGLAFDRALLTRHTHYYLCLIFFWIKAELVSNARRRCNNFLFFRVQLRPKEINNIAKYSIYTFKT